MNPTAGKKQNSKTKTIAMFQLKGIQKKGIPLYLLFLFTSVFNCLDWKSIPIKYYLLCLAY
jgi:hypothetical protein